MHPDEAAFRSMVELASDAIVLLAPDGTVAYANPAAESLFGQSLASLNGAELGGLVTDEAQSDIYIAHPQRGNVAANARSRTIRLSGNAYTALYLRDVSERVRSEERLQQFAVAMNTMDQGVIIVQPDMTIVAVNAAFTTITGYSEEETQGHTPEFLRSGQSQDDEEATEMRRILKRGERWTGKTWRRRKNGDIFDVWLSISPVHNDSNRLIYYVALFSDTTYTNELWRLAHRDHLTGLLNRGALQPHLDRETRRVARYDAAFSLIMFDLDNFKVVNDNYGHDTGDRVLQQIAGAIVDQLRDTDMVARWGGEEFLILLPATDSDGTFWMAERLRQCVAAATFPEVGSVTISLGIAQSSAGESQQDMLIRLDQALYRAKEKRNQCELALEPQSDATDACY